MSSFQNQTKILVQVLDIDEFSSGSHDPMLVPDLIDKFSQPLTFQPSPDYWSSVKHVIHLQHYVRYVITACIKVQVYFFAWFYYIIL